jgi:type IV pilus assembly protein PilQ
MKKNVIAIAIATFFSNAALANTLEHMQLNFLKNNDSILKFDFDENVSEIEEFKNEENVIYFRLPKTKSQLDTDYFDIDEGGIKNVKLQDRGNSLHVYISTDESKNVNYTIKDDKLSLNFKKGNDVTYEEFNNITDSKMELFIDDISFEKESDEQVKINISYDQKDSFYDVFEHENGITLYFEEAVLPSRLFRNNDLEAFNTPIKSYFSKVEDGKVKVNIDFNDKFDSDYFITKSKNALSIIVKGKKKSLNDTSKSDDFQKVNTQIFKGENITFNFQDMDIEDALFTIAQKMKLNLVLGDDIKGKISLILNDVPYDQALDVILRTKGLDKIIEGNIMIVAPMEEIAQRKEFELMSKNKIKTIKPLTNEEVQVNYAKATELMPLLETMKSERGKIMIDDRTNKIFLEDIDEKIISMKNLIDSVDIPIRQVSVEARIVYAKKSASQEIGVRWQSGLSNDVSSYNPIGNSSIGIGAGSGLGSVNGVGDAANITLGFVNANIEATLAALEKEGDIEIVARPLVIAADKQTSSIASGQEYPYREIKEDEITVNFKEILLELNVTPQITPDDKLILDLGIIQDSISEMTEVGPALDKTEIKSKVIVDNNETLVLGGVFKEDLVNSEDKVPLLGDLPLIGNAFKYQNETREEVELLIFITPKILNGEEIINR